MSALGSLVRVHRWVLDEKRRKLTDVERFLHKMESDLARLDEHLEAERQAAAKSLEGRAAYATFIAAALQRRERLTETIANLGREAELARAEVNEAFQELKKYETARDNVQDREALQQKRREQLALDEIGVSLYRRRAAGDDVVD